MQDAFDLGHFVEAQAPVMEDVRRELGGGRKRTHWMWFVFPQIAGLGRSATAQRYAIASLDEAAAYLRHPVLGPRLLACAAIAAAVPDGSAEEVFGSIDAIKLRSSMTLFAAAAPDEEVFDHVLERYFDGEPDPATLDLLRRDAT